LTIIRNASWLFACRIAGDVLSLLLFVLISRKFGPAGVGVYSYAFAVTGFVFVIGGLGIEEYGLREYARMDPARRSRAMAELFGAQLVMIAAAVVGVGLYLSLTAPSAATLSVMASLGYYQAALALSATLFIPAMGQQHMLGCAFIDLLCRGAAFICTGIAINAWDVPLPQAMLAYPVAGSLLVFLSRRSAVRYSGPFRIIISRDALVRIVAALWSFAAVEVLAQIVARAGVIVLSLQVGAAAAGLYATGLRLIEVGLMPLAYMGVAAYPKMSRLFMEDRSKFQSFGLDFIWAVLAAGVILAWGLYFLAPPLLVPVLGAKYAGTEPVVRLMAALALIEALELGMGRVLFAANLQVLRAVAISLGAVSALVLNMVFTRTLGADGAIAAGVLSFVIINAVYFAGLRRPLGGARLLQAVLLPLVALVVAVSVAWGCRLHGMPDGVQAAASVVAFMLVAGAAFWYLHGQRLFPDRGG
jgi:O-antigen/teichoic acid export membrane protein